MATFMASSRRALGCGTEWPLFTNSTEPLLESSAGWATIMIMRRTRKTAANENRQSSRRE